MYNEYTRRHLSRSTKCRFKCTLRAYAILLDLKLISRINVYCMFEWILKDMLTEFSVLNIDYFKDHVTCFNVESETHIINIIYCRF
jgi:hypothetical protein